MKNALKIFLFVSFFVAVATVLAKVPVSQAAQQQSTLKSQLSQHQGGWELGATLGYDRINTGQIGRAQTTSGTATYKNYGNAFWGMHTGYYWPISARLLLGIETGYQSFGHAKMRLLGSTNYKYKTNSIEAWNAVLAARFYVLNHLALFGKLGGAYTWINLQIENDSGSYNQKEVRRFFNPTWQLGVLVDLSKHISATLAFDQLLGSPGSNITAAYNPTVMGLLAGINWDMQAHSLSPIVSGHLGGLELGASLGYDRIDTGQPGRAASAPGAGYVYRHYGNMQLGAHAGYYWPILSRLLLGVEAGYQSFGGAELRYEGGSTAYYVRSVSAWDMLFAARFYVLDHLAVFGKLGSAFTWVDLKTRNDSGSINIKEMRRFFNPEWQLGVLIDLSRHITATLGIDRLVGTPSQPIEGAVGANNPNVMGILAGVNWDMNGVDISRFSPMHAGGWALGSAIGYDRVNTGQAGSASTSNNNIIYKNYGNAQWDVHIGYYWSILSRLLLGVETGYQAFGGAEERIESSNLSLKANSIEAVNMVLAARFYVLNHLAIFGKLGGAYTWVNAQSQNDSGSINFEEVRKFFNPTWQLGILVNLSAHLGATLAIDRLVGSPGANTSAIFNPDVMGVLAGLNWDINASHMTSMSIVHPGGWELGVSAGYDRIDTGQQGRSSSTTGRYQYRNYGDEQWGAHVGYYWPIFRRLLLGVEGGYQSYGGAEMRDTQSLVTYKTRSIQAWEVLLAMRFYVLNHLAVYSQWGGAYTSIDLQTKSDAGIAQTERRYFFNPAWQLGVLIDINQYMTATVGIDRLVGHPGVNNFSAANPSAMGVLAGINVRF